jgi:hypothetical protein
MVFDKKDRDGDEGGFIPDMVRRAVDRSLQALNTTDDERKKLMSALLPKDLVQSVMQSALQAVDTTKREAVEIVGREMQQFLSSLNLAEELRKVLTSVSFQISTEVRFVPNEDGTLRSEVKARATPKRVTPEGRKRPASKAKAAAPPKTRSARKTPAKSAAKAHGPSVVDTTFSSARGAMHDAMQGAVAGTRSRVRQVVDRIAERTADLTEDLAGGEED